MQKQYGLKTKWILKSWFGIICSIPYSQLNQAEFKEKQQGLAWFGQKSEIKNCVRSGFSSLLAFFLHMFCNIVGPLNSVLCLIIHSFTGEINKQNTTFIIQSKWNLNLYALAVNWGKFRPPQTLVLKKEKKKGHIKWLRLLLLPLLLTSGYRSNQALMWESFHIL